jgi:hypothetical protein
MLQHKFIPSNCKPKGLQEKVHNSTLFGEMFL